MVHGGVVCHGKAQAKALQPISFKLRIPREGRMIENSTLSQGTMNEMEGHAHGARIENSLARQGAGEHHLNLVLIKNLKHMSP